MPVDSTPRLRRTFIILAVSTGAVFAALLLGITWSLQSRLRQEVVQREAEVMYAVSRLQINATEGRLKSLGGELSRADLFTAVLESSRMSGVLSVQLFDNTGVLRDALPAASQPDAGELWWGHALTSPVGRFHPEGTLEEVFGLTREPGAEPLRTPLLEVVVPLGRKYGDGSLGVARYWVDGQATRAELTRSTRRLTFQAGVAFAGGGMIVILLLAWSYRRLAASDELLLERSADLARANEELDFSAKTAALGAISAHLIHGLKNPLAGLEGYVNAAPDDDAPDGEARRTAVETARRLRTLVNEVVTVLRDESTGTADYPVPIDELLESVRLRAQAQADRASVSLAFDAEPGVQLSARVANLSGLVLSNLLTNAIEASPPDRVLRVDARREPTSVRIDVTDQGPGLPESVRATLFRPVRSSKSGGSGLGLAISHRLARHAGGELSLVRSDGSGTVFRLNVPSLA